MTKTNYLLCSGEACPFRFACQRWQNWMNSEDDGADEMAPAYNPKKQNCDLFQEIGYYGG